MRKVLLSLVASIALVAFGVGTAGATDTATIGVTVTVTAAALDISVDPTSWAIGSLAESGTDETTTDAYTVTNNTNNATVDLNIISGGSANWTAGDTAGSEVFVMKAELQTGGMTAIDTSQTLATDVAASGGTYSFDLGFQAPSSTTHAGIEQSITVTITAAI